MVSGTVVRVVVDEGQLIAEDEPLAFVDDQGFEAAIVTAVPGVVRELYVDRGTIVRATDVVARIDES
jgi:biotin carboxyl carrier protein